MDKKGEYEEGSLDAAIVTASFTQASAKTRWTGQHGAQSGSESAYSGPVGYLRVGAGLDQRACIGARFSALCANTILFIGR